MKMDKLNYGIKTSGNLIAIFMVEYDRDRCMAVLAEEFDDCEFEAVKVE